MPAGRKGTFQLDVPLGFCHLALTWVHFISVDHTLFEAEALSYYTFFLGTEILIVVEAYRYKKNYCPGIISQYHLVPGNEFCAACFKYTYFLKQINIEIYVETRKTSQQQFIKIYI